MRPSRVGVPASGMAVDAAGKVNAFVNQVNAQRGKKIDPATADLLIELASRL